LKFLGFLTSLNIYSYNEPKKLKAPDMYEPWPL
jgi:hypothetical protein